MSELDTQAESQRLFSCLGAIAAEIQARTQADLWKLLPFIKALTRVSAAHEEELLTAWKNALLEPMPFGCKPIGLPGSDEASEKP